MPLHRYLQLLLASSSKTFSYRLRSAMKSDECPCRSFVRCAVCGLLDAAFLLTDRSVWIWCWWDAIWVGVDLRIIILESLLQRAKSASGSVMVYAALASERNERAVMFGLCSLLFGHAFHLSNHLRAPTNRTWQPFARPITFSFKCRHSID